MLVSDIGFIAGVILAFILVPGVVGLFCVAASAPDRQKALVATFAAEKGQSILALPSRKVAAVFVFWLFLLYYMAVVVRAFMQ